MLKKENRLQKEKDFGKVFKGSRPIYAENLVFRFATRKRADLTQNNAEATQKDGFVYSQDSHISSSPNKLIPNSYNLNSRFGFVISNKISKLATRRNALKRQLRAIIENEMTNIKTGYDVIIMVKSDFNYPYEQKVIKKQVDELLKEAGLLKWRD